MGKSKTQYLQEVSVLGKCAIITLHYLHCYQWLTRCKDVILTMLKQHVLSETEREWVYTNYIILLTVAYERAARPGPCTQKPVCIVNKCYDRPVGRYKLSNTAQKASRIAWNADRFYCHLHFTVFIRRAIHMEKRKHNQKLLMN